MCDSNNVLGGQSPAFGHAQSVSCNEAIGFYIDGFNLYHSVKDIKEAHINHKPINTIKKGNVHF